MADQAQTALFLVVALAAATFALVYHISKLNKRIQKLESLSTECATLDACELPDSEFKPINALPTLPEEKLSTECVEA
jgi:hypothetical protein